MRKIESLIFMFKEVNMLKEKKKVKVKVVPCEVYSRVVGYFRPIKNWNKGKKREFKERKTLKIPQ